MIWFVNQTVTSTRTEKNGVEFWKVCCWHDPHSVEAFGPHYLMNENWGIRGSSQIMYASDQKISRSVCMAQMAQLYCRNVEISTEKEPVGCRSSASCSWIVSFCVAWLSCRQGGSVCPMCWEGMVSVPARDPDQWDEEAAQLYLHTHQATHLLEAQGHELCCRE